MNKRIAFGLLILWAAAMIAGPAMGAAQKTELSGNLSLSGAWALYPMAVKWAEEFQKIHPRVRIDVQAGGAGKGLTDALTGMVDIGMVSREIQPVEIEKGAFPIAVNKDAVIPTLNARNPFLQQLLKRGVKRDEFAGVWISGAVTTWGDLLGTSDKTPIRVFTRSDSCGAAETWAAYLGKRQEDLTGIGVYGDPGLADAVRRDPLAVGFNNVNFAYDARTLKPIEGLVVCPLDINGNGVVDPAEGVYATRDDLTKAIAENVFPSPPARDLYFVTKGKPGKPALVEFIRWVLTEGQKFVPETGYINLSPEKLREGLSRIGAGT